MKDDFDKVFKDMDQVFKQMDKVFLTVDKRMMEVAEEAPEEIVASTVDNLNVGMKPVAKNNDG